MREWEAANPLFAQPIHSHQAEKKFTGRISQVLNQYPLSTSKVNKKHISAKLEPFILTICCRE